MLSPYNLHTTCLRIANNDASTRTGRSLRHQRFSAKMNVICPTDGRRSSRCRTKSRSSPAASSCSTRAIAASSSSALGNAHIESPSRQTASSGPSRMAGIETLPSFACRRSLPTENPKAAIAHDAEIVFIQLTAAPRLPPCRASPRPACTPDTSNTRATPSVATLAKRQGRCRAEGRAPEEFALKCTICPGPKGAMTVNTPLYTRAKDPRDGPGDSLAIDVGQRRPTRSRLPVAPEN
jgi:hypothetical protein